MPEIDWQQIHLIVITILGPILVGVAVAFFRNKLRCLDKVDKRSFRQSKGLLNMASKLDELKENLHPNEPKTNFHKQMKSDLTDEKGNL